MIYKDPAASLVQRVEDLVSQMTLPEKLAQMHALWLVLSEDGEHKLRPDASNAFSTGDPGVVQKLIANGLGQITRPLGTFGVEPRAGVRALNRFQKDIIEGTRLGIPVMSLSERSAALSDVARAWHRCLMCHAMLGGGVRKSASPKTRI